MAAELEKSLGVRATLERGASGVFDVMVDGIQVFSKHRAGRFPLPGEVEGLLRARTEA